MGSSMKDGDIYRWSYKKPKDFMPYHCRSQIAVVKNGHLVDTYWSMSDGAHWTPEEAERDLHLELVANFADLRKADPGAVDYYAREDIVDLRHPNNSSRDNVYLRVSAVRSADVMRETVLHAIERSESQIRMAEDRIKRCREQLAKIDAGEVNGLWIESQRERA